MSAQNGNADAGLVVGQTSHGTEIRGNLLRVTRYVAAFEVYAPNLVLHTSEVLQDFKLILHEHTVYSGRAVVSSLVNTGTMLVVEVKLEEAGFAVASFAPAEANGSTGHDFNQFLAHWQKLYKVRPEFKVVIADMESFLLDLRLWLEQVELEIRSAPAGDRLQLERDAAHQLGAAMVPAFDAMHERLESISGTIEEELRPVHQNFSKRHLHSIVMGSPFAYRTFHKPLGYAGDYEMVNMILRDPYEGSSLFSKVVNLWFLSQWPAKAHRNRVQYLRGLLRQESLRGAARGRPVRILNLGCGPAGEVQEFLASDEACNYAQFTLLDFNEETIQYTSRVLEELRRRHGRRTQIQIQKKSVHHVLKEGAKPVVESADKKYDLIYCAGLFDYLPDRTCKQLMGVFYEWLAPGGLVAATNVDDCKPFRHMLEFVLDWHLIYRDVKRGSTLVPEMAGTDNMRICKDPTDVNLFIEVRKPAHA